jgi:hypothetical protein
VDYLTLWNNLGAVGVPGDVILRFVPKVRFRPDDGCWEWIGACDSGGYGMFTIRQDGAWVDRLAHRIAYQWLRGEIAHELDHLCRNPPCIRPDHLEDVTHSENMLRGRLPNRDKTHCKRGHPFDAENTRVVRNSRNGRPARQCRACKRDRDRERRSLKTG